MYLMKTLQYQLFYNPVMNKYLNSRYTEKDAAFG